MDHKRSSRVGRNSLNSLDTPGKGQIGYNKTTNEKYLAQTHFSHSVLECLCPSKTGHPELHMWTDQYGQNGTITFSHDSHYHS